MKTITFKQGSILYKLDGGFGSWAKSTEAADIPIGTVRVIDGVLMKAFSIYSNVFKFDINWIPVDDAFNTAENLRSWIRK